LKIESRIRRNYGDIAISVSEIRRNFNHDNITHAHFIEHEIPSLDHPASKRELKGFIPGIRAVKNTPGFEPSTIMGYNFMTDPGTLSGTLL
jgi:hypothetical protein